MGSITPPSRSRFGVTFLGPFADVPGDVPGYIGPRSVSSSSSAFTISPNKVIAILGDSIAAAPNDFGFAQELVNYCNMLYGASAPTFLNFGTGGVTLERQISDGHVAALIAAAPDMVIQETIVNNLAVLSPNVPTIRAAANAVYAALRAGLPNVPILQTSPWTTYVDLENWGPGTGTLADIAATALTLACADSGVFYADVHYTNQQPDEVAYNSPAPGVDRGINTIDGVHPNQYGRPLYGVAMRSRVAFSGIIYPEPNWSTYLPTDDVAPFLWMEADMISQGDGTPIATWTGSVGVGGATGSARPTYVATGWGRGAGSLPCVRFDGIANAMKLTGITTPAGAKTIWAIYRFSAAAPGFGNYYSLLSLPSSPGITTEFIPSFTGGTSPLIVNNWDYKASGADGFFGLGTNDITQAVQLTRMATRYAGSWAGGPSCTDATKYQPYWGGSTAGVVKQASFLAQTNAAIAALGARYSDGVTPTQFSALDLVAVFGVAGVLPVQIFHRIDEYLRRKWGP